MYRYYYMYVYLGFSNDLINLHRCVVENKNSNDGRQPAEAGIGYNVAHFSKIKGQLGA